MDLATLPGTVPFSSFFFFSYCFFPLLPTPLSSPVILLAFFFTVSYSVSQSAALTAGGPPSTSHGPTGHEPRTMKM